MAEGSSEVVNYVVAPGFHLEVTDLRLDPLQPIWGSALKLTMVVKNTGAGTAPVFPYRFTADPQATIDGGAGTCSPLGPGQEKSILATMRPLTQRRGTLHPDELKITADVDPQNTLNVLPGLRNHNYRSVTANVSAPPLQSIMPPRPVLVVGRTHLSPGTWRTLFTVCNVDATTAYTFNCDTGRDLLCDSGLPNLQPMYADGAVSCRTVQAVRAPAQGSTRRNRRSVR